MFRNTKTKKVVAVLVAVAFVVSLSASLAQADTVMTTTTTSSTTTSAPAYVFTRNLTIGSTGADVSALQMFLVARGFLVMPAGVNYGYFGNLTKAALGAFQASVGISPTAGYFGPITRTYLAAHPELFGATTGTTTSSVPGCSSTAGFSSTTGQPCNGGVTGSSVPGCTSTAGYSPTTGQPCNGSTTTTSSTGEGTLTVTQGPPGGNSNIQQNTDVQVYGLQLRAQLGDVRVDRIDLDVADTVLSTPNSIENPGNFINNVKIWDGTNVLLNRNVSASDFVTGTSSTDYYLRLSGIGFMVPNGTTKNLVVSFSTSGSIDTNRMLTIRGYGATSLLYYTGNNNTTNYADISGSGNTVVQTFQKPGNSTVILGVDPSNPLSMTNYVDANNGTQSPIPLFVFNTNTTQGSSQITQVTAGISASGTLPTGLHLFQGANELQYQPVTGASSTVSFNNLYASNATGGNVYSIKADYPAATNEGSQASTTVYNVTYKNSNGNQQVVNGPISGNAQYFFSATPQLAFTSGTAVVNNNQSGNTVTTSGTFNFTATPYPGQAAIYVASGADFTVVAKNGVSTISASSTSVTITPQPTNGIMSAGQQYNVQLSAVFNSLPKGIWTLYVTTASSTVQNAKGTNVHIGQTWGFDNWHTNPVTVS